MGCACPVDNDEVHAQHPWGLAVSTMSLRIVGGRLRGRRLQGPVGPHTRPTADRVREAVASMLESRAALRGAYVVDLFAGTGALAFEALSRGAEKALLVDHQPAALRTMRESAERLGLEPQVSLLRLDLLKSPERTVARLETVLERPVDVIFADAPYAAVAQVPALLGALGQSGKLADGALAVIEHDQRRVPEVADGFTSLGAYRYGDTGVLLWAWKGPRKDAV
jgi:16S rRNA (guanine966-N2)-methyltransferase